MWGFSLIASFRFLFTRNRKLSALGSYYLFLECFEYIDEDQNPTSLIRRAKTSRSLPVFLNLEETQSILRVSSYGLHGERNLALMRLMLLKMHIPDYESDGATGSINFFDISVRTWGRVVEDLAAVLLKDESRF